MPCTAHTKTVEPQAEPTALFEGGCMERGAEGMRRGE